MCGVIGNIGFMKCILHKMEAVGFSLTLFLRLIRLQRTAVYKILCLPSSPRELRGKPFQVKGLVLVLSLSIWRT